MNETESDFIKCRDIYFCPLHPDFDQAQSAVHLLDAVSGIEGAHKTSRHCLQIIYDLRLITLQMIEGTLIELGFHLQTGLLIKLKRALFYYTEETQRANMGHHPDLNSTQSVFVNRYWQIPHGCRDERQPHWREYL